MMKLREHHLVFGDDVSRCNAAGRKGAPGYHRLCRWMKKRLKQGVSGSCMNNLLSTTGSFRNWSACHL
jgi:cytochrome c5